MKPNKKEIFQIAGSAILTAGLLYAMANFGKKEESLAPLVSGKQIKAAPSKIIVTETDVYAKLEEETRALELKRDPFVPVAESENKYSADLVLEGILWDPEQPMAIINDHIVRKGDRIGSNVVTGIEKDRVIIFDGRKELDLRVSN